MLWNTSAGEWKRTHSISVIFCQILDTAGNLVSFKALRLSCVYSERNFHPRKGCEIHAEMLIWGERVTLEFLFESNQQRGNNHWKKLVIISAIYFPWKNRIWKMLSWGHHEKEHITIWIKYCHKIWMNIQMMQIIWQISF